MVYEVNVSPEHAEDVTVAVTAQDRGVAVHVPVGPSQGPFDLLKAPLDVTSHTPGRLPDVVTEPRRVQNSFGEVHAVVVAGEVVEEGPHGTPPLAVTDNGVDGKGGHGLTPVTQSRDTETPGHTFADVLTPAPPPRDRLDTEDGIQPQPKTLSERSTLYPRYDPE